MLLIQVLFLVFGTGMRAYIIPEAISSGMGLLLILALVQDGVIYYVTGGHTVNILLPSFVLLIMTLLTIFPVVYVIMRVHGGG